MRGDFENSLDFSRLKTSSLGTLFAFISILLLNEKAGDEKGVRFMWKKVVLGTVTWLILLAVVAFLQNA